MSAGTITVSRTSTTITGSGTSFTTELKPGDFIVARVGGTAYTLGVASIESNTSLTLSVAYGGPTTGGVSWQAVPMATLNLITSALAAQVTEALRANNLDRNNWQQVLTGTGTVTVNLPDGTQYSGPAWGYITNVLNTKANTSSLGDAATRNVGTAAGTVAAGNDSRLSTVNGKSGGTINGSVSFNNQAQEPSGNVVATGPVIKGADPNYDVYFQYYFVKAQYHSFRMVMNGYVPLEVRSSGACFAASFNPTSDARLKLNKERITNALEKVKTLSGYTFDLFGERRTGGLAQEIREVLPEVITETFIDHTLPDGTVVKNGLAVDYGATFGLMVEAIKGLDEKLESRDAMIAELQKRMKAIDGLDA